VNTTSRSSFRLRLALQTIFVAGVVVTAFGAGAWWYALDQQARNLDLRIAHEAHQLWTQLIPRHREEDFAQAVKATFGRSELPVAVTVMWHRDGNPFFSITEPKLNESNRALFVRYLPKGSTVVTQAVETVNTLRQRRPISSEGASAGTPLRPAMPEIRTPDFFTLKETSGHWRFGAFSNPHYTVFVGLSENDLHAGARRSALVFAGAGALALLLAGLGAWWTSGRAMRPLDRIVAIANRMSAGNLDERIPLLVGDDREFTQLIGALNDMTARLQDNFEQAARFTADASHELRTPLAVMQSTLNEALRTPSLDEATRERISVVLHQTSRLKHITHSLLLLSQADARALPLKPEHYDLSKDLAGLMEDAESLCQGGGLKFAQQIEPSVMVEADRALMHQVFQNLVSNAIKHNVPHGSVQVRLSSGEKGVRFEITNSSAEVSAEAKQRLFDRFFPPKRHAARMASASA
jgi:signal transduction histidine kinase